MDVLASDRHLDDLAVTERSELLDRRVDERVRRGGTGRQANHLMARDHVFGERALSVDQLRLRPGVTGNLYEALRIRARLRADHEDECRSLGEPLDGVLAVLGGVTDVIRPWTRERTEALFQSVHRRAHVVERQRRLADHGDGPAVGLEPGSRLRRFDDHRRLRALATRTDHLDVVGVADERDEMAGVRVAARLRMNLGDERTDGVHDTQAALLAVLTDGRRNTVRGEDADLTGRDLVLVVDEDGAETLETTHDMVVVHDLVPDVDRRTVLGEQALDDLDRAVDSRTKRPRCRKQDAFAHAIASSALSARRAPTAARSVTSGCRAKPRRKPR